MSYEIPEHLRKFDWYEPHLKWLGFDVPEVEPKRADLRGADLRGADLRDAYLCGADLCGADLRGAYLSGAYLRGARLNWQSHDLLAYILWGASGDDIGKRKIAGLILVSRDWCWKQFLAFDEPLRDWALDELAKWVKDGDDAPECVRERAAVLMEGE